MEPIEPNRAKTESTDMTTMANFTWDHLKLCGQPDMFRADPDIAASQFHHRYSLLELSELIDGYSTWMKRYVAGGWRPFLLSIMFRPLTKGSRMAQMTRTYLKIADCCRSGINVE
jgi:hypothetical protein